MSAREKEKTSKQTWNTLCNQTPLESRSWKVVEDDVKMTQVEEVATAVAGSIPIKRKYGEKISPGFVQKIQKIRIGWYPRLFAQIFAHIERFSGVPSSADANEAYGSLTEAVRNVLSKDVSIVMYSEILMTFWSKIKRI